MNWQEKIYESLRETRLSARERAKGKGASTDPIVKASGDPEAHGSRWSPISKGSKLSPRTPIPKRVPGESYSKTLARLAAEKRSSMK